MVERSNATASDGKEFSAKNHLLGGANPPQIVKQSQVRDWVEVEQGAGAGDGDPDQMSKNQKRNRRRKRAKIETKPVEAQQACKQPAQKLSMRPIAKGKPEVAQKPSFKGAVKGGLTMTRLAGPNKNKMANSGPPQASTQQMVEQRHMGQKRMLPTPGGRQYPFMRYAPEKVHLEVHTSGTSEGASDTLVAIKVTTKVIEDNGQYTKFYRENTHEHVPERTKAEIFQLDKQAYEMQPKDIQKFYRSRYFLFSKFDRGVQIDREGWYSVTPEPFAKHLAGRVQETFKPKLQSHLFTDELDEGQDNERYEERVNVLDAFGGVGGNVVQFGLNGYCVGVDLDPTKVHCIRNNAEVYGLRESQDFQVLQRDFLKMESYEQANLIGQDDPNKDCLRFPASNANKQFNAVFMSPPWGGTGYNLLDEYSLEHVYPEFDSIIEKAVQYSPNLMLFLPRNTSISDLVGRLAKFQNKLIGETRKEQLSDQLANLGEEEGQKKHIGELAFEVESLAVGTKVTAIVVYTGELARINSKEVLQAIIDSQCMSGSGAGSQGFSRAASSCGGGGPGSKGASRGGSSASSVKSGASSSLNTQFEYIRAILSNVLTYGGSRHFIRFLKRSGKSKLSLQRVVKSLQKSFSAEDWYYYRKIHKRDKNYFLNKGGQRGDQGGGGWVAFDTKMSRSTNSKISSKRSVSSVEETKSGIINQSGLLLGVKGGVGRGTSSRKRRGHGRIRTLSNSEVSSSGKGSNDDIAAAAYASDEQMNVSHDMLMIDEVHTSQESENLSSTSKRLLRSTRLAVQPPASAFLNLSSLVQDPGMMAADAEIDIDADEHYSDSMEDQDSWKKVRPRKNKQHIELKDLTETDFVSLLEAKNQDKRFYGWLNFQPLFQGIETGDPTEEHERFLQEEDQFLFFTDLFGLHMEEEDSEMMTQNH